MSCTTYKFAHNSRFRFKVCKTIVQHKQSPRLRELIEADTLPGGNDGGPEEGLGVCVQPQRERGNPGRETKPQRRQCYTCTNWTTPSFIARLECETHRVKYLLRTRCKDRDHNIGLYIAIITNVKFILCYANLPVLYFFLFFGDKSFLYRISILSFFTTELSFLDAAGKEPRIVSLWQHYPPLDDQRNLLFKESYRPASPNLAEICEPRSANNNKTILVTHLIL